MRRDDESGQAASDARYLARSKLGLFVLTLWAASR